MKVAVVIPCFNVGSHVEAALRSAFSQTHPDLEILAVDDGSTDNTREVLERLRSGMPGRFQWVSQDRRGACAARNTGMRRTSGEYIQFLDADDVLDRDKIAGQVALAEAGGRPDIVVGDFRNVYPDMSAKDVHGLGSDPWKALVRSELGTTSANLWKRSAVEAVGGWNEAMPSSQDYELAFRLLARGATVIWDPRLGSSILKRDKGSISNTDMDGNWERYIALRVAIREHLLTLPPEDAAGGLADVDRYIFNAVRVLSRTDPQAANRAFKRSVPRDFVPQKDLATTSTYVLMFRLFGFRTAERLARVFGILRHSITGR